MRWCIVTSIIDVHKGPVDDGHRLQKVRQHLAQIVGVFEWRDCRENNVDFDKQLVAGVVGAEVLNLADSGGEAHGQVQKEITLVGLGRETSEVTHMVSRGLAPCEDDHEG